MSTVSLLRTAVQITEEQLSPLKWWLYEKHYASAEVYHILASVIDRGSLDRVVEARVLDPEDEALAYEKLEGCFTGAEQGHLAWTDTDHDTWAGGEAIPSDALLIPPLPTKGIPVIRFRSGPKDNPPADWTAWRAAEGLPPIAGGSPETDQAQQWIGEDEAAMNRDWPGKD